MKRLVLIALAALASTACTADGQTADNQPRPSSVRHASLDEALAGRSAEAPTDCVSERMLGSNRGFHDGAILFETGTRALVYVNRPLAACPDLNEFRAIRVTTTSTQLCRGDIVTVFDPSTRMIYGSCSLGEFTPYRRN